MIGRMKYLEMNYRRPRMSEIELLPCPFCGAHAKTPIRNNGMYGRPRWETGCVLFCISMLAGSKKELVQRWNTRPALAAKEAELAKAWEAGRKLNDFLIDHPECVVDIPDEIYVPFVEALK